MACFRCQWLLHVILIGQYSSVISQDPQLEWRIVNLYPKIETAKQDETNPNKNQMICAQLRSDIYWRMLYSNILLIQKVRVLLCTLVFVWQKSLKHASYFFILFYYSDWNEFPSQMPKGSDGNSVLYEYCENQWIKIQ